MDKKHQKCPQNRFFLKCDPKIFLQKSSSVIFLLIWCSNFLQKIRKTNVLSLWYSKSDHGRTAGRTTEEQGWLHRIPLDDQCSFEWSSLLFINTSIKVYPVKFHLAYLRVLVVTIDNLITWSNCQSSNPHLEIKIKISKQYWNMYTMEVDRQSFKPPNIR